MIQAKLHQMIQAKLCQNQVTPATICNDSFKFIDTLASEGKASIRQLIVTLTFERSIDAFPIFQLIDVSVPDEKNCAVYSKWLQTGTTLSSSQPLSMTALSSWLSS